MPTESLLLGLAGRHTKGLSGWARSCQDGVEAKQSSFRVAHAHENALHQAGTAGVGEKQLSHDDWMVS